MPNNKYARLGYGISLSSDELIPSEYLALGEPWDEELILRVMGMPPKESGLEINTHHLRGAKEGFMIPVLVIDEDNIFCHGQASNGDAPVDVTGVIEEFEEKEEVWDARIRAFVQGYEKLNMKPKLHETIPHLILYFSEDI